MIRPRANHLSGNKSKFLCSGLVQFGTARKTSVTVVPATGEQHLPVHEQGCGRRVITYSMRPLARPTKCVGSRIKELIPKQNLPACQQRGRSTRTKESQCFTIVSRNAEATRRRFVKYRFGGKSKIRAGSRKENLAVIEENRILPNLESR